MSQPNDSIDMAMRSQARQFLKSLDRPRPGSTSLGFYFTGIFIFLWASSLTTELGYPFQGIGIAVLIGIGLVLAALIVGTNHLLNRMGLSRPLRSALWFSAVCGPYLTIAARTRWENPVWGHLTGFATTLIAFCISLAVDALTERKPRQRNAEPATKE